MRRIWLSLRLRCLCLNLSGLPMNCAHQLKVELSGRRNLAGGTCSRAMQADAIKQIRERRGLSPVPPRAKEFYEAE